MPSSSCATTQHKSATRNQATDRRTERLASRDIETLQSAYKLLSIINYVNKSKHIIHRHTHTRMRHRSQQRERGFCVLGFLFPHCSAHHTEAHPCRGVWPRESSCFLHLIMDCTARGKDFTSSKVLQLRDAFPVWPGLEVCLEGSGNKR